MLLHPPHEVSDGLHAAMEIVGRHQRRVGVRRWRYAFGEHLVEFSLGSCGEEGEREGGRKGGRGREGGGEGGRKEGRKGEGEREGGRGGIENLVEDAGRHAHQL